MVQKALTHGESFGFECFSTSKLHVHEALLSFPNSSIGDSPQLLKNRTAKSNGLSELIFLKAFINLIKVILGGKVPDYLRPQLIALKKPHRGCLKCAGYHVPDTRQAEIQKTSRCWYKKSEIIPRLYWLLIELAKSC